MMPAPDLSQTLPGAPSSDTDLAGPPCILLVDDERAFADTLCLRLSTRGVSSLVAYDGDSALRCLENTGIQVVLLDLNLPGTHGLDVLRQMKTLRPDVEVILFTGDTSLQSAATGMRRGAGDYLVKPVEMEALLTSIAKARQRVALHREQLRAMDAAKLMALGSLATGVGHEINNPLQVLLQRAELLQELVQDARDVWPADNTEMPDLGLIQSTAAIMEQQTRRIAAITSQLLDLAYRSKAGGAETDLAPVLHSLLGTLKERADALNIGMNLEVDTPLPALPYSRAELEPIFMHLCRNALDAIEAVKEHVPEKQHHVRVTAKQREHALVVTVSDTGEGVGSAHAAEIFNPFFSTRPVGKGVGLGLTVCHSLVTAIRGDITFAPLPTGGTQFMVILPLQTEN